MSQITEQYARLEFIEEPETLTTYSYISNGLCFEYFVGYEITTLLNYKDTAQAVKNLVSKCNQLLFREYPGVKQPPLDPRVILISRDGVCEILQSTRKLITPTMKHMLDELQFNLTNCKKLSPEQKNLSFITNAFKIEETIPQYPVGRYRLDLYFPKYKIIIECDENGHADRHPEKEKEREDFVNQELGTTSANWVRFNPDDPFYDVAKVMGQIYLRINELLPKETETEIRYVEAVPKKLTYEDKIQILESSHLSRARKNIDLLDEKPCTYCNVVKPLEAFHNAKDHRDGKENICRICKKEKDLKRVEKYRAENDLPVEKSCNICNDTKSLEDFYRDKNSPDGRMRRCKKCHRDRGKTPQTRITIMEKCCTSCNVTKDVSEFYKLSRSRDGYKIYCKDCSKRKSKDFRDKSLVKL
jgi:very-short-patch-repair endonuclease